MATPRSVTAILNVRNNETTLSREVGYWLEVLPDVAPRFEVLIVDRDSTDATEEVAAELAGEYPQVRLLRLTGRDATRITQRRLLTFARGEVVFWIDGAVQPSFQMIRQASAAHRFDEPQDLSKARQGRPLSPLRRFVHRLSSSVAGESVVSQPWGEGFEVTYR